MTKLKYQKIHDAHGALVRAVKKSTKPGYNPVSVDDGKRFARETIVAKLRLATDFIESEMTYDRSQT